MARTRASLRHPNGEHENREKDDVTDRQPSLENGSNLTADQTRTVELLISTRLFHFASWRD
jgi:hypothetical protein